ncbi:unnamed protein product [Ceutorhynchus assimilis]|uniref:TGF-beta family profile domain-containing protein n=1 Tax=Ceutorhynchus assimilis TaxID=467358 RepID=A0A9N9MTM8_9CUCU|nr:unnamed protein product [Ceutorhynchus assimilis]
MLDLYAALNEEDNQTSNRVRRQTFASLHRLRQDEIVKGRISDVILSMTCVNRKSDGVGQRQKLAFSMESVPKSARLVGAELKFYQDGKLARKLPFNIYKISVFKLLQLTPKLIKMKKVGEKLTSTDYTGWLSMDISYLFQTWLEYPQELQEIYISAQPFTITDEKEIHPATIGITFQNELLENEPFIVAFSQANNRVVSRLTRNANSLQSKRPDLPDILSNNDKCEMYTLKISFNDLGWSDWVIAPAGYTTAFCQGPCNFPMKMPLKVTHHAIVQSLMHLKNPKKIPQPKCSPMETSHLSVLFKQKENTILKKYKNMIIRSCGCQ